MDIHFPQNNKYGYHMLCRFPNTKYSLHFVWLNGNTLWISKYKISQSKSELSSPISSDSKVWEAPFLQIKISSLSAIHEFEELVPTDMSAAYHFGINGTGKLGSNYSDVSWSLAFRSKDECRTWKRAFEEAGQFSDSQRTSGTDKKLAAMVTRMMQEIPVTDRYFNFNKYSQCFLGADAVTWLMNDLSCPMEYALSVGDQLVNLGLMAHCLYEHSLRNSTSLFYRFHPDMLLSVSGSRGAKSLGQTLAASASSSATKKEELAVAYLIDTVEQLQGDLAVELSRSKCQSRMNRNLEASIKALSTEARSAIRRGRAAKQALQRAATALELLAGVVLLLALVVIRPYAPSVALTAVATVIFGAVVSNEKRIHDVMVNCLMSSSSGTDVREGARSTASSPSPDHRLPQSPPGSLTVDTALPSDAQSIVDPSGAPTIPDTDATQPHRLLSEAVLYENVDPVEAVSSIDDASSPPLSPRAPSRGDGEVNVLELPVEGTEEADASSKMMAVPERYIRGCGGEMEEARRRWELTLRWRREERVDQILSEPQPHFHIIKECYPHFFHGRSNGKRSGDQDRSYCVYYEQLGKLNLAKLKQKQVSVPQILRHYIFLSEYIYTYLEPDNQYGRTITVLDVTGVGLSDLVGDALEFLKASSKMTQDHYVERCQKIFVVNASYMFTFLWRMVQPLINENTRQKVSILGSDMTELRDYVGASQLPEEYGGPKGAVLGSSEDEKGIVQLVEKLNCTAKKNSS